MRHGHSALLLLSLLLCGCQGPRVTVRVNELKPGMLKGRTVGVGGMVATFAAWPGKPVEPNVLSQAEQALQRSLKSSRVFALPADAMVHAAVRSRYYGEVKTGAALDADVARYAKTHAGQADYFFVFMLRKDSVDHIIKSGAETEYNSLSARTNEAGVSPYSRAPLARRYSWRGLTQHTLKADYLLYESRTNRIVWRARTVHADEDMSINETTVGYRTPTKWAPWMPTSTTDRLWMPMNAATARTLR